MIFHVTLDQADDGWVVVECPALPGCVSQGKDEKEALENIKEAITLYLEPSRVKIETEGKVFEVEVPA